MYISHISINIYLCIGLKNGLGFVVFMNVCCWLITVFFLTFTFLVNDFHEIFYDLGSGINRLYHLLLQLPSY